MLRCTAARTARSQLTECVGYRWNLLLKHKSGFDQQMITSWSLSRPSSRPMPGRAARLGGPKRQHRRGPRRNSMTHSKSFARSGSAALLIAALALAGASPALAGEITGEGTSLKNADGTLNGN